MDDLLRASTAVLSYFVLLGGARARGALPGLSFEGVRATLREWRQRARARRELARFDDHALRDIGLSRSQAQFESGKPFWQP